MANFILVNDGNGEYLLNLDTVVTITPYEAAYGSEEGDTNGVLVKHTHEEESILYEGLDFKSIKAKLLNKQ